MPAILKLTGEIKSVYAVRASSGGSIGYNASQVHLIGGENVQTSTKTFGTNYRTAVFFNNPADELIDRIFADEKFISCELFFSHIYTPKQPQSGKGITAQFAAKTLIAPISADSRTNYENFGKGSTISSIRDGNDNDFTIKITDKETLKNVLKYGFSLVDTYDYKPWDNFAGHFLGNINGMHPDDYSQFMRAFLAEIKPEFDVFLTLKYHSREAPSECTITAPKENGVIDLSNDLTLSWDYLQDADMPQTHVDIDYSYDNGNAWIRLADKYETAAHEYVVPTDTLGSGIITWRVRAYSLSGTVTGNWSAVRRFLGRANANCPKNITCDSKPRPTVSWDKTIRQQGFQVRALDSTGIGYDSGVVWGETSTFQIKKYLISGSAEISVRTISEIGEWSDWGYCYPVIVNENNSKISTIAFVRDNYVEINWTCDGDFNTYEIYRGDLRLGTTPNPFFNDYTACGECEYRVRGITTDDFYCFSNPCRVIIDFKHSIIMPISDFSKSVILMFKMGGNVGMTGSVSTDEQYEFYSGRNKPILLSKKNKTKTFKFSYSLKKYDDVLRLENLVGETVIFRSVGGIKTIGILGNLQIQNQKYYFDIGFSITETDYHEGDRFPEVVYKPAEKPIIMNTMDMNMAPFNVRKCDIQTYPVIYGNISENVSGIPFSACDLSFGIGNITTKITTVRKINGIDIKTVGVSETIAGVAIDVDLPVFNLNSSVSVEIAAQTAEVAE